MATTDFPTTTVQTTPQTSFAQTTPTIPVTPTTAPKVKIIKQW